MKYILGIDTTFHTCGVALVEEDGRVLINEKSEIDFTDESAKKFFTFHNKNVLSLVKPILSKYADDIFLVSASCKEGTFHALPVGAVVANAVSHFFNKKIVGVSHEIAHLYSNWLDRESGSFLFPIVSLSISGGHSNIYLMKNIYETEKVKKIVWREDSNQFGGLGVLFGRLCYFLNIEVKRGEGGAFFEKMSEKGKPEYKNYFNDIAVKRGKNEIRLENIEQCVLKKLKELGYYSFRGEKKEKFQNDFAASITEILFDLLASFLKEIAEESGAKELHLVGGIATNKLLKIRLENLCRSSGLNFKAPLRPEFCGDNGAMAAIAGYYKWKGGSTGYDEEFLTIETSDWYYEYYAKHFGK